MEQREQEAVILAALRNPAGWSPAAARLGRMACRSQSTLAGHTKPITDEGFGILITSRDIVAGTLEQLATSGVTTLLPVDKSSKRNRAVLNVLRGLVNRAQFRYGAGQISHDVDTPVQRQPPGD